MTKGPMKLFFLCMVLCSFASADLSDWLGLDDENSFRCAYSRKLIPKDYINDNFCDCVEDGSDEPLTDACANGKFFCDSYHKNLEKHIFSSHVNDGICDCCDGTDEPEGTCPNECAEKAAVYIAEQELAMNKYREGSAIKEEWKKQGMEAQNSRADKIDALQGEVDDLKRRREEIRAQKTEQENLENAEEEEAKAVKTQEFIDALKLDSQSPEAIKMGIAYTAGKSSKATESMIECLNDKAQGEADDVTSLSIAVEVAGGYKYTELYEARTEQRSQRDELDNLKRKEPGLQRKRRELIKEQDKEKEAKPKTKLSKLEKLAELKNLRDKKEEEKVEERDEEEDYWADLDDNYEFDKYSRHNKGTFANTDHLKSVASVDAELAKLRSQIYDQEDVVNRMKEKVHALEDKQNELETAWRKEKVREMYVALGLDFADLEGMRTCLWDVGVEHKHERRLLDMFINDFGLKFEGDKLDLVPPSERYTHTRQEADEARTQYRMIDQEFRAKDDELMKMMKEDDYDFGRDEEYFPLIGQCFATKADKYVYEFCPFNNAKQDHTPLGNFDVESWNADKSEMRFTRGRRCMDKDRLAVVKFLCGPEPTLGKVTEPERCEYHMVFENPASCTEPPY